MASTSSPTTAGASATSAPSSSPRRSATGFIDRLGSGPLAGRGARRARSGPPARAAARSSAGSPRSACRRRSAPSSGTFRSARSRTRLPPASASRTLAFASTAALRADGGRLEDLAGELDAAVRVSPLVVVPGEDLDHVALEHHRLARVEDRRVRVADDVGRDDRVLGVGEDPLERALGGGLDRAVDLLDARVPGGLEGQVDDASRWPRGRGSPSR